MSSDKPYDVIVVGAGVIGCAVARELAEDHDTLVIDKSDVGSGASGMAAGLTAPTLFAYDSPAVAHYTNEFLRNFSGTEGFIYRPRSRIEFIHPEDETAAREQADEMAANGFPVSFQPVEEIEAKYPAFDPQSFAGAIEIADAGYIDDTYVYTRALARDAKNRGAEFLTEQKVTDVAVEKDDIVGVKTANETIAGSHVVVAAGWHTRQLLDDVLSIPIRPFLLQAASIDVEGGLDPEYPLGRLPAENVYFRPQTNGRLRVGGGEHLVNNPAAHAAGVANATDVEAGMKQRDETAQEVVNNGIDEEFRTRVEQTVPLFMDAFDSASDVEIITGWGSVDAATADGEPIIDAPAAAPDGLALATGFNGLGSTKSPVAAAGVRAVITGEEVPFSLDQFAFDRLPDSLDFTLQDTFAMGRE